METWDAIRMRRDVRRFDPTPIADDLLERVLEAGRRSPSSQNWQPWNFVVVTKRDDLERLSRVWKGAGHVAHSAATIALVAADQPDPRQRDRLHYDLGQATMQMMLAAADVRIGSGHSVVEDQSLAREVLGLDEDHRCSYLIALGWPMNPLETVNQPDRRPFDQVVRFV